MACLGIYDLEYNKSLGPIFKRIEKKLKTSNFSLWLSEKAATNRRINASSFRGVLHLLNSILSNIKDASRQYSHNDKILTKRHNEISDLITRIYQKCTLLTLERNDDKISDKVKETAQSYGSFVFYKICFVLSKINEVIENMINDQEILDTLDKNFFRFVDGKESLIERMYRDTRIFIFHYSYTLGLSMEGLTDSSNSTLFKEIFVNIQQDNHSSFSDFLQSNERIAPIVVKGEGKVFTNYLQQSLLYVMMTSYHEAHYNDRYRSDITKKLIAYDELNDKTITDNSAVKPAFNALKRDMQNDETMALLSKIESIKDGVSRAIKDEVRDIIKDEVRDIKKKTDLLLTQDEIRAKPPTEEEINDITAAFDSLNKQELSDIFSLFRISYTGDKDADRENEDNISAINSLVSRAVNYDYQSFCLWLKATFNGSVFLGFYILGYIGVYFENNELSKYGKPFNKGGT